MTKQQIIERRWNLNSHYGPHDKTHKMIRLVLDILQDSAATKPKKRFRIPG